MSAYTQNKTFNLYIFALMHTRFLVFINVAHLYYQIVYMGYSLYKACVHICVQQVAV